MFEKKKSTTVKLSAKQLIVTFLENVPTELKKKKKIAHQLDHRINKRAFQLVTSSVVLYDAVYKSDEDFVKLTISELMLNIKNNNTAALIYA